MTLIFLAFYLVFIGGSAYYTLVLPVRIFHHMLLTVLIVLWFWGRLRLRRGLPATRLNMPIYASVIVSTLSAIVSIDPRMAFEHLWFAFIHIVFFFVLVDLFQRGRHRLVMETQFILAALVIFITGLEIVSWYFGLGFVPGTNIGWVAAIESGVLLPLELPRVALAMNISTLLAGYVAPLVTLTIGWALTARRLDYRRVLRWLVGLLVVVLLLTFSRGGLLSLGAAVVVFSALRFVAVGQRYLLERLGTLMTVGAMVTVLIGGIVFTVMSVSGTRSTGDEVRLDLYRSAINMTVDSPLFGVGPGLYGRALRTYRSPEFARDRLASAHNLYLNTSAETGLLGVGVAMWLVWAFVGAAAQTWREADVPAQRIRIEAALAALVGVAVHSLVDVFTITPIVLLILLLAAFSITGTRSVLHQPLRGVMWPCIVGLVIAVAYGVWFIQTDRAYLNYQVSLSNLESEDSLQLARTAAAIDPHLNLYDLHIAYILGQRAYDSRADDQITQAVAAYEKALALEPTWDVGWMNLAALESLRGNDAIALDYVENAYGINPILEAGWNWPRLLDQQERASNEEIAGLYAAHLPNLVSQRRYLPTSTMWLESSERELGLDAYTETLSVDLQYRIYAVYDAERAATLVKPEPESAAGWWVLGEHTLTVMDDAPSAVEYFGRAISLSRLNGDYYAARARAYAQFDQHRAVRDLNLAELLGTRYERPLALRAEFETDADERRRLLARSLPPRPVAQEFAAVLYGGRIAILDLLPDMRYPGPGRLGMQPWYSVAEAYIEIGDFEAGREVYEAILAYAPDEEDARDRLSALP